MRKDNAPALLGPAQAESALSEHGHSNIMNMTHYQVLPGRIATHGQRGNADSVSTRNHTRPRRYVALRSSCLVAQTRGHTSCGLPRRPAPAPHAHPPRNCVTRWPVDMTVAWVRGTQLHT